MRSKGACASSNLPASILEKSRISSIRAVSAEARGAHGFDIALLFGIEACRDEQFGHAQDAVERRPDLMAHGGEQARFRFARGFGAGARLFGLFDFEARFEREFLLERGGEPPAEPDAQAKQGQRDKGQNAARRHAEEHKWGRRKEG